jgi:hypothetical protein
MRLVIASDALTTEAGPLVVADGIASNTTINRRYPEATARLREHRAAAHALASGSGVGE